MAPGEELPHNRVNRSILKSLTEGRDFVRSRGRFTPLGILAITIGGIALAEVVAMIVVYFIRHLPYANQVLIDAAVMTLIITPLLYFLSFQPLLQQIKQRQQSEQIVRSRLRLVDYSHAHTLDELLQFTLDEVEALTGSTIGFFHFIESDQTMIELHAWSTNTMQDMCKAEQKRGHYDVEDAGVWADAVRQHQAVIHNDYASLPHHKGMPKGHAQVVRELVVPIMRKRNVVAILGVGNKPVEYNANDLDVATTLADFAWDIVNRKQAENALLQSEEKFRTLADWTYDWEKWMDPDGNLVYTSPSCERITGYRAEEFIADPKLLFEIIHPDDQSQYVDHHKLLHDSTAGFEMLEYRIIDREGEVHWIEHLCRPLFGKEGNYLGRRVSSREISKRKQAEEKISEQAEKEAILNQKIRTIQTELARDLHDTLGQNISFLRMNLEHLSDSKMGLPDSINRQIQNMSKAANESYELIRAMLVILQIGNTHDPISMFTAYAEQISARTSLQINITTLGEERQLSTHQIRQLFYIFREALNNVEKYSSASQVSGQFLWEDHSLRMVISDDGRGFDRDSVPPTGHYGLKFMRERAEMLKGSFSIDTKVGYGTTVTVMVPFE